MNRITISAKHKNSKTKFQRQYATNNTASLHTDTLDNPTQLQLTPLYTLTTASNPPFNTPGLPFTCTYIMNTNIIIRVANMYKHIQIHIYIYIYIYNVISSYTSRQCPSVTTDTLSNSPFNYHFPLHLLNQHSPLLPFSTTPLFSSLSSPSPHYHSPSLPLLLIHQCIT